MRAPRMRNSQNGGLFSRVERLLRPTEIVPPTAPPPDRLPAFYWYHLRQVKYLVGALFVTGFAVALLDTAVPVFLGRLVTLVSASTPQNFWARSGGEVLAMAAVILILRPAAVAAQYLLTNQAINPGLTSMVRWQNHWHVVRQGWGFFQNDFAGRIANRVVTTGPALRESVVQAINAVLYVAVYGGSALSLLAGADLRLAAPLAAWFVAYALMLRHFVPRTRARSRQVSEARSTLTGRIVDAYSNILTVKLFARARDEDGWIREAVDAHTDAQRAQLRMISAIALWLNALNTLLLVSVVAIAGWLWSSGSITLGAVAMALPLVWQVTNLSGWVAQNITAILENIGVVQDGMKSIAQPRQNPDAPGAGELVLAAPGQPRGGIRFEQVSFGYGRSAGVLHGIDLAIRPGERIGLLGHSGAGKSTLVHLLLGFFRPESGRILIDGQDIALVTQESLRQQIGMVTQDSSLLHRSIHDNIAYGRPEATTAAILAAAEQAQASGFIADLEDLSGHRGMAALVGERGVKLSGGQRQRIAIARVILKDAPILILDEATSALDSEVEAAIQTQLDQLMSGRTVIAIAHRLSTIARMDRLVVLSQGRIVEIGSHAELLARGGAYSALWARQSGGFTTDPPPP